MSNNGKKTSQKPSTKVFSTSKSGKTKTTGQSQIKRGKEEEQYGKFKRSHPERNPIKRSGQSGPKDAQGFLVVEKLGPSKVAIYRNHAGTGGSNRPVRRSIASALGKHIGERISGSSSRSLIDARSGNRIRTSSGNTGLYDGRHKIVVLGSDSKLPRAVFSPLRSDKVGGKVSFLSFDPSKNSRPNQMLGIPLENDKSESSLDAQTTMTGDLNNIKLDSFDFLMVLAIPASTKGGDILYSVIIDPSLFQRTRAAAWSNMFDRAELEGISLHYRPAVSTITDGAVIMYFDPDPDSPPVGGQAGIEFAASTGTMQQVQVFKEASTFWKPPVEDEQWTHNEGSDPRLFAFGKIVILAANDIASAISPGNIFIGMHLRYKEPVLNMNSLYGYGLYTDTLGTTPNAGFPFGQQVGLAGVLPLSNIPDVFYDGTAPNSSGIFIFPPGHWLFVYYVAGTTVGSATITKGAQVTQVYSGACTNSSNNVVHGHQLIKVNNGTELDRSFAITFSTLSGAVISDQLIIAQMPNFTSIVALKALNYLEMLENIGTLKGQVSDLQDQVSVLETPFDNNSNAPISQPLDTLHMQKLRNYLREFEK